MKKLRSIFIIFLIIIMTIVSFSQPTNVFACSCSGPTVTRAFYTADVVFSGKVSHTQRLGDSELVYFIISRLSPYLPEQISSHLYQQLYQRASFEVIDSWKGVKEKNIVVWGGGCFGTHFFRDSTYLVYATETDNGYLYAHLCSRTALLNSDHATDDLAFLVSQPTIPLHEPPKFRGAMMLGVFVFIMLYFSRRLLKKLYANNWSKTV